MSVRAASAWGVAGLGVLLLAFALVRHHPWQQDDLPPLVKDQGRQTSPVSGQIYLPAPPPVKPTLESPETAAKAALNVRIQGTYANYRNAVAAGNRPLQEVLLPILRRDRDQVFRCAQNDLAHARTEHDQEVAKKVMDDLRR